jgi:chromate transporter
LDTLTDGMVEPPISPARTPLLTLAGVFLKLGATSFGGPAAHVAMLEEEVVRRRRWIDREQFLDYLGASNLIPGPTSTELAIHVGQARAGGAGLLVAGLAFILPAALAVTAIAWAYVRFGALPALDAALYGIKPVVIAVIGQALAGLIGSAIKSTTTAIVGGAAAVAAAAGAHEIAVLAGAAAIGMAGRLRSGRPMATSLLTALIGGSAGTPLAAAAPAVAAVGPWPLFLIFLKIGSVLFGSGYVLFAFLRADLVGRLGWISEAQLLDAIAVGQMTPGPLFTSATFIGYLLAGPAGAAAATVGIFAPAFVFVAISEPLVRRIRASPAASAALDGVNAASLALMAVVSWQLARAALVDLPTLAMALTSAAALMVRRVNSGWLVLAGAALGLLVRG